MYKLFIIIIYLCIYDPIKHFCLLLLLLALLRLLTLPLVIVILVLGRVLRDLVSYK